MNEAPKFYLDGATEDLSKRCGGFSLSMLNQILKKKLWYVLQVCYELAKKIDEIEREMYKVT